MRSFFQRRFSPLLDRYNLDPAHSYSLSYEMTPEKAKKKLF